MNDLDTLLRRDARELPADAGFSQRVLRALPPRPLASRRWWKPLLVMGSAVVGSALAALLSPQLESPVAALAAGHLSSGAIASLAIGGALLLSGLVLAFDQ